MSTIFCFTVGCRCGTQVQVSADGSAFGAPHSSTSTVHSGGAPRPHRPHRQVIRSITPSQGQRFFTRPPEWVMHAQVVSSHPSSTQRPGPDDGCLLVGGQNVPLPIWWRTAQRTRLGGKNATVDERFFYAALPLAFLMSTYVQNMPSLYTRHAVRFLCVPGAKRTQRRARGKPGGGLLGDF